MALSSLVLMVGLATGAAAQTCATTDVAITGVTPAPSDPAALVGDCTTLLGLMDTLRGTASLNWATTLSMDAWDGITVTGSRVTELHRSNHQLTGTIPAALNSLTSLRSLRLLTNQLSGSIPDLSSLTSLEDLWIGQNQLSGSIPDLSSLTNLRRLYLHQNQLSGNIPDLSTLTNLTHIFLNHNQLSGNIPDLSTLTNLTNIELRRNRLSGSIPDLSALTNLQQLHLQQNNLSGNIPDLSSLAQLHNLQLFQNQLRGPIPDLSALTNLTVLFLYQNQLSGSIPDLSSLTKLTHLYLHRNRLSGSIPDLSSLTKLRFFRLDNNQLTGSIDASFFPNSLNWFLLHQNPFTGGIPSQLGSLTSLTELSLCGTTLDASATLPAALETRRTGGQLRVWSCLRIEDASATEGSALDFAVEHSTYPVRGVAGATGGLTLSYETKDGTATSADYTGTAAGSLTIPANTDTDNSTSSAAINVPTTSDALTEADETLTVTLLSGWPSGVFLLRLTATGTILDDGGPPIRDGDRGRSPPPPFVCSPPPPLGLTLADTTVVEGDIAQFVVRLKDAMDHQVCVEYVTVAGTAKATQDYKGGEDVILIRRGATTDTIKVPTLPDTEAEGDETFMVLLLNTPDFGHIEATATILDDDVPQPPSSLTITDATVVEGEIARFAVRLDTAQAHLVGVAWQTVSVTARGNQDYDTRRDTLLIPAGETTGLIEVPTRTDTEREGDEVFAVRLLNAPSKVEATGTILSAFLPRLTLADATVVEGEIARFVVRLIEGPVVGVVSVQWRTTSVTARGNQDYDVRRDTLLIPPGETTGLIEVPTRTDAEQEGDEVFTVRLLHSDGPLEATGTILDDRPADTTGLPQLTIADTTAVEGHPVVFAVVLSAQSAQPVTVEWTVLGGTATQNADYALVSLFDLLAAFEAGLTFEELLVLSTGGVLTISAGQTRATFSIRTLQDQQVEGDETLHVMLVNPTEATLAKATATATIQDDDSPPPKP